MITTQNEMKESRLSDYVTECVTLGHTSCNFDVVTIICFATLPTVTAIIKR